MIYLDMWMKSPLLIGGTVALFIILDIRLTRMWNRLRQEGYNKYFIQDIFEMNPLHQDTVHKEQPLQIRDIIGWLGLIAAITVLSFYFKEGELEILYGAIVLGYLGVILRHCEIIFIFYNVKNHPEHLNGQIKIEVPYLFMLTRARSGVHGFIWLSIYFMIDRVFFLGGALWSGIMIGISFFWERASLKKLQT